MPFNRDFKKAEKHLLMQSFFLHLRMKTYVYNSARQKKELLPTLT